MRSGLWAGKNSPEPHVCLWFWLLSCLNPSCLVTAHTGLEPSRGHLLTPEKVSVGAGDSDTCEPHSLVHQRRQTGEQICPAHSTHTQWGGARWRGRVKGSRGGTREWGCKSENPPQQLQPLCTDPIQAPTLRLTDLPSGYPWGAQGGPCIPPPNSRKSHGQPPPAKAFQNLTPSFTNTADISPSQNKRE